jgi:hypothetical protein
MEVDGRTGLSLHWRSHLFVPKISLPSTLGAVRFETRDPACDHLIVAVGGRRERQGVIAARHMIKRLLNRREFNGLCVMFGSSLGGMLAGTSGAAAPAPAAGTASTGVQRTVKFRDGIVVPALGQASAQLAQGRHPEAVEEEALRTGLSLGMTLIDTAELYGDGRSEKLIGRVITGQRDGVFLVSKVWPNHATRSGIPRACEASLTRLGTDHLDLMCLRRSKVSRANSGGQIRVSV